MKRMPSAKTGSIGVTRTQLAVQEKLGWLFREQFNHDYGIDAQVEVVAGDRVLGRLLALQIKSGPSWFKEPTVDGWWFRPERKHVSYWTSHSLPVVVVLYDESSERCHWQLVNSDTLVAVGDGGWKLLIPRSHVLDEAAADDLRKAAAGDPYELRIRELRLSRPWMEMLRDDTRLVVDIEEWVNKTSGRGSIRLGIDNEDGNDPMPLASWGVDLGLRSYAEVVPTLFPWASVGLHEETYDDADARSEWSAENYEYGLGPYRNGAGEVDFWRLELSLNELGRSFMVVDDFAMRPGRQLTPKP